MTNSQNKCLLFRVGQIAEKTGKTNRTIHFYEQKGLLAPQSRSAGGYRLYGESALLRIQWIDQLQSMGFTLTEIQDFLSSFQQNESGPQLMEALQQFYSQQLIETRLKIQRLRALEKELSGSLSFLQTCSGCHSQAKPSACKSCGEHQQEWPRMITAIMPDQAEHKETT